MAMSSVGKNATNEFFEEITLGVGNSFDVISALPDTDIDILNEAMQSGISVLKMGAMMAILQKQELFLEKIMDYLFAGVGITLAGGVGLLRKGLKRFKGVRAKNRIPFFSSRSSDTINLCRLGTELALNKSSARTSVNSALDRYNVSLRGKDHIVNSEQHKMQFANAKAQSYNNTLMFKLFTQGFTQKDKTIIKRILGKDVSANMDIEDLNQVANFMYIKDDKGNLTGLSEEFMTLLNGLGYLHNKN